MRQDVTRNALAIRKLVALKRQRAEQDLAQATTAIRAEQAELERLQAELAALDATTAGYGDIALSARFGHSSFLLQQLAAARDRIAARREALEAARDALRRAIHSENQLESPSRS